MRVFDRIDPDDIDRREIDLRLLAITTISVLALGSAIMMYPAVFSTPMALSGPMFQTVFFGFCTLSVLLIAYLVDRHILVTKLRARIVAREKAIRLIQEEASKDFLASLPAIDTFKDRISMELRRAAGLNQPLSVFAAEINLRPEICKPSETAVVHADAGRAILRKIRGEDSLFLLDPGVFALLLPRVSSGTAELMKEGFEQELRDAAGLVPRFHFRIRLINFPDDVKSAHEVIEAIYPLLATHPDQAHSLQAVSSSAAFA